MLATTQSYATYQGNGATTRFPYNFLVQAASQLVVSITNNNVSPAVTTVLSTTQYNVTGIGNATGGTVTYPVSGTPLPAGWSITIQRIVPYQQNTSLTNQGAFYPAVVEAALDYLTMQTQQVAAAVSAGLAIGFSSNQLLLEDQQNDETYEVISSDGDLGLQPITGGGATVFYQPSLGWVTPQQYGAKGDGVTDDTAAFNAAMSALGTRGGIVLVDGCFYIGGGLTIPDNVFLVGNELNPGGRVDGAYTAANFRSMLIVNGANSITMGDKCGVMNMLIIEKNLAPWGSYPLPFANLATAQAAIAAFNGNLFVPAVVTSGQGGNGDQRLENLLVLGFAYVFNASGINPSNGMARPLFRNIKFDCTNGFALYDVYDVGRCENLHGICFTTSTNQAWVEALTQPQQNAIDARSGTAFYSGSGSGWTKWADCFGYGYNITHFVEDSQVRQTNCGADGPGTIGFYYYFSSSTLPYTAINEGCHSTITGVDQISINAAAWEGMASVQLIAPTLLGSASDAMVNVVAGNYKILGGVINNNLIKPYIQLQSGAGSGTVSGTEIQNQNSSAYAPVIGDAGAISRCEISGLSYSGTFVMKQGMIPWTPVLSFGGSSTGITYATQAGWYEVHGNLVTCYYALVLTSKGSQTGGATLSLPLASGGGAGPGGGNVVTNNSNMSGLTAAPIILQVGGASSYALFTQQGVTGTSALSNANFTNTSALYGSFQYSLD